MSSAVPPDIRRAVGRGDARSKHVIIGGLESGGGPSVSSACACLSAQEADQTNSFSARS